MWFRYVLCAHILCVLLIFNVEQCTHTDVNYNIVFSSFGVGYVIWGIKQQQQQLKWEKNYHKIRLNEVRTKKKNQQNIAH